ncbi:ASCH domain-containing protein [Acinetobacter variabilis]|uniref:ASCH domain-containing protein n=1 Tax=Acinetobacter variabilis TaxID=70346 RepID=UPI003D76A6A8
MSIVLSIKPLFTNLILSGQKTIEMRSKIGTKFANDSKIIIYSSTPTKAIVGIAKIKSIQQVRKDQITALDLKRVCISYTFFENYMKNRDFCYLIELKDIVPLAKPISLSDLRKLNFTAPQSFCYSSEDLNLLVKSHL